jgi:hypothetical protein
VAHAALFLGQFGIAEAEADAQRRAASNSGWVSGPGMADSKKASTSA